MNKTKVVVSGFIVGVFISLSTCYSIYKETEPQTSVYMPTKEWRQFERTCSELCLPYASIIIGEPIPGKVSEDTYCVCSSKPPRLAAKWR